MPRESMRPSQRSKIALCQLLTLLKRGDLVLLLEKYGLPTHEIENKMKASSRVVVLRNAIIAASDFQIEEILRELARMIDSIRFCVKNTYVFEQRWKELCRCLKLDGCTKEQNENGREQNRFAPIGPVVNGACCSCRRSPDQEYPIAESLADTVIVKLMTAFTTVTSTLGFRNICAALQTLVKVIAQSYHANRFEKLGEIIIYLRKSGYITKEQERFIIWAAVLLWLFHIFS